MSRIRIALASLGVAALLAPAAALAAKPVVLSGVVGPDTTIVLKNAKGAKVTKLKAGKYTIKIADKAAFHDFHLTGPGVNKVITGLGFVGTKSVIVTLKKGTYKYVCDPHSDHMNGSFTVS
jgi:plastocyanin